MAMEASVAWATAMEATDMAGAAHGPMEDMDSLASTKLL